MSKFLSANVALGRSSDEAATNELEALVRELQAVSGKKVSEEDAEALIESAREIIEAISKG